MIKHENIAEMAQTFVNALQDATKKAKTEKDFDDLENIVVDLLCGIPITILQKDFWTRESIRQRVPEEYQNDTDAINRVMYSLYSHDVIALTGDDFIENLDDDIDATIEIIKGVRHGK